MAKVGFGNRIGPPRFIAFCVLLLAAVPIAARSLAWPPAILVGFDFAALVFLVSAVPMLGLRDADKIRAHGRENEANRAVMLGITVAVMGVMLVAVEIELSQKSAPDQTAVALVIATLAIAWIFANVVFALHYAHLYYAPHPHEKGDARGLAFPDTPEPDYGDFLYFSFTVGMCFQTSDVAILSGRFRRIVGIHSLAAFIFNIGVLAFTINVLGNLNPAGA